MGKGRFRPSAVQQPFFFLPPHFLAMLFTSFHSFISILPFSTLETLIPASAKDSIPPAPKTIWIRESGTPPFIQYVTIMQMMKHRRKTPRITSTTLVVFRFFFCFAGRFPPMACHTTTPARNASRTATRASSRAAPFTSPPPPGLQCGG